MIESDRAREQQGLRLVLAATAPRGELLKCFPCGWRWRADGGDCPMCRSVSASIVGARDL